MMKNDAHIALILESLPVGVILVSATDYSITVINQQAVQLLQNIGAPLEPLDNIHAASHHAIGINCEQLLQEIQMFRANSALLPYEEHPLFIALHTGHSKEIELHTTTRDGQLIYLLVNATPFSTADGTITNAVLVYQDITHIKLLEHAREDFFTTMAHELKTPLANIRANLSALLAQDLQWSSEERYSFLQTADQQIDRLVGMINHFLDASRVEAGALRLMLEPVLIPELIEDLQDRLEALINASQQKLQVILPEQLPAVCGDYELIMAVLTNLLSNAFRYEPAGRAVQILAEPVFDDRLPQQKPCGVRLSVIDHGPGIDEAQQEILFTRFSTLAELNRPARHRPGQPEHTHQQAASRWSPATGLGLYISRGIIEAHGSQLELVNSSGSGAHFAFILPVYKKRHRQGNDQAIPETAARGEASS